MTKRLMLFVRDGENEVVTRGLTELQAREICENPKTKGEGWFMGFEEEG